MKSAHDDATRAPMTSSDVVMSVSIFVLTILFIYAFRALEISDNSIMYVDRVQTGTGLFYPPHLLHAPNITILHALLSHFTACDVVCAGTIHSVAWAAVTVVSTYLIVRSVLGSMAVGLLAAAMLLVAHGFWVYATQLEVYVPAAGCITAASALLLTNPAPRLGPVRLLGVAVLWALGTTYHLANVVLCIPFAVYFYGVQGGRGWRQWMILSATAGSLVLATFISVYWSLTGTFSAHGFLTWVLSITDVPMTPWGSLSHWSPAALALAAQQQILALTRIPEYLSGSQTSLWLLTAIVAASMLWNLVHALRDPKSHWVRIFFITWFLAYFLFFAWWEPYVLKFFILSSIPLIISMAIAAHDLYLRARMGRARQVVVAGALVMPAVWFGFNLSSVLELRRSLGPDYAEAALLDELAPKNCRIYAIGHHLNPLRVYFDRRDDVSMRFFLSAFYGRMTGEPRAEVVSPADEDCALIRLGYLSKAYFGDRTGGYLDDATWVDYIAYFFDVQPAADGGITHSAFELVAQPAGPPLVLVDRGHRIHVASVADLATAIATAVDAASAEFGPDLHNIRNANVDLGRDRNWIFGYASGDRGPDDRLAGANR